MAAVDMEPVVLIPKLESIESTICDISYREAIKNSANFNARLTVDRKHRIPFLDTQTGIAQVPSSLYFDARQRLPGMKSGQIYSYPSKRWRKKKRQYLSNYNTIPKRKDDSDSNDFAMTSFIENNSIGSINEDSKDSIGVKEQDSSGPKDAWFYDELEMQEIDGFDDPDPDSDFDYEDSYSARMKRKKRGLIGFGGRGSGRGVSSFGGESPTHRRGGRSSMGGSSPGSTGRGRRKAMTYVDLTDSDKPFACDLCGARYKTRPGLTYHYTHSHKEGTCADVVPTRRGGDSSSNSSSRILNEEENSSSQDGPPGSPGSGKDKSGKSSSEGDNAGWSKFQDSYVTFLNSPGAPTTPGKKGGPPSKSAPPSSGNTSGGNSNPSSAATSPTPESKSGPTPSSTPSKSNSGSKSGTKSDPSFPPLLLELDIDKARAKPSPYCDFCLGDTMNKKSGQPEDLVSCSDCGRSGHPTCLQFTGNMKISVRKYRWQCIECKCCSICSKSDNDDQLLFCDDCDRGYHMYCLVPPIDVPPEGSWSCILCIEEYPPKKKTKDSS